MRWPHSFLQGKFPGIDDSVIVSRDGHILDGHHRWAALLTIDPARKIKVRVLDMNMEELLQEAQVVPGVYKADFEGNPLPEADQIEYKRKAKSKFKGKGKGKGKKGADLTTFLTSKIQARVASRYQFAHVINAAGTEDDIKATLPKFQVALAHFDSEMAAARLMNLTPTWLRYKVGMFWVTIIREGRTLVDAVMSTRSIPTREVKNLELAYRLLDNANRSMRMPTDFFKWWATNQKRLELVARAAITWPAKQEGSEELFAVGPFRIVNTIGATGAELDSLKNAVARVAVLGLKNPVPGFARAVYGDIHVVARITKAHHAAWYYPHEDSLYLRRARHTGMDEIHAILHELGHRYLAKFATNEQKMEWRQHHRVADGKGVEVELPVVGDTLPVQVGKAKGYPTITKIEGGKFFYEIDVDGKTHANSIPVLKVYSFYRQQQRVSKNFPTAYSATSAEEHFCEALALYALGNLRGEHLAAFESIWHK